MLRLFCEKVRGLCPDVLASGSVILIYMALYLTRETVVEAQELLHKYSNLNTSVVSNYVTSAIIRKYAGRESWSEFCTSLTNKSLYL